MLRDPRKAIVLCVLGWSLGAPWARAQTGAAAVGMVSCVGAVRCVSPKTVPVATNPPATLTPVGVDSTPKLLPTLSFEDSWFRQDSKYEQALCSAPFASDRAGCRYESMPGLKFRRVGWHALSLSPSVLNHVRAESAPGRRFVVVWTDERDRTPIVSQEFVLSKFDRR